jgi:hypothetical protein
MRIRFRAASTTNATLALTFAVPSGNSFARSRLDVLSCTPLPRLRAGRHCCDPGEDAELVDGSGPRLRYTQHIRALEQVTTART